MTGGKMKKKIVEIAFLFIFLLAMAFYMDKSGWK